MDSPGLTLTINIAETGSDAEQLDDLTRHLQRDLYDLGVEEAERPPGSLTPVGAKGDPLSIGALALVAVPAVLPNVVSLLQSWVLRGQGRTVRIKTPAGLEVEFESEHRLSQDEILALVGRLEAGPRAAVDPLPETRKEDPLTPKAVIEPDKSLVIPAKVRILFLAANPKDTTPLRLGEEVRSIDGALRRAAGGSDPRIGN